MKTRFDSPQLRVVQTNYHPESVRLDDQRSHQETTAYQLIVSEASLWITGSTDLSVDMLSPIDSLELFKDQGQICLKKL